MKLAIQRLKSLNSELAALAPKYPKEVLARWVGLIETNGMDSFNLKSATLAVKNWNFSIGIQYTSGITIKSIVAGNSPTLAAIARYDDQFNAIGYCIAHITAAVKYFNLGGNMKAEQIEETACLLFEMYRTLTIDDIVLCFKWAKAGRFGEMYDRLDGAVILKWFEKYQAFRNDAIEAERINQHQFQKQAEKNDSGWTAEGKEAFKKILDSLSALQEAYKVNEQKKKEEAAEAAKNDFEANRLNEQKKICSEAEISEIKHHIIHHTYLPPCKHV